MKKLPVPQTLAVVRQPIPTQVAKKTEIQEPPITEVISDSAIMRELRGNIPHFIPQKVNEEEKPREEKTEVVAENTSAPAIRQEITPRQLKNDKYPKALSWLAEFKRS